jgi:hypothetical protein
VRVLLDECCHRRILQALSGFDVTTAQKLGWSGVQNGELLKRLENRFDVLVTQDQNLHGRIRLPAEASR